MLLSILEHQEDTSGQEKQGRPTEVRQDDQRHQGCQRDTWIFKSALDGMIMMVKMMLTMMMMTMMMMTMMMMTMMMLAITMIGA